MGESQSGIGSIGVWHEMHMWTQGRQNRTSCGIMPTICRVVEQLPATSLARAVGKTGEAVDFGDVKLSMIRPGTHIAPHCGPTNAKIRAHMGLLTPPGPYIRVASETRRWEFGKFLIFDDSFEHEVRYDLPGAGHRVVLLVDLVNPWKDQQQLQKRVSSGEL